MGNHFSIFKGPKCDNRDLTNTDLIEWKGRYSSLEKIVEYQNKRAAVKPHVLTLEKSFRRTLATLQQVSKNEERLNEIYGKDYGYRWKSGDKNERILTIDEEPSIGCIFQIYREKAGNNKAGFEDWYKIDKSKISDSGLALVAMRRFPAGSIVSFVMGHLVAIKKEPGTKWDDPDDDAKNNLWKLPHHPDYTTTVRDLQGYATIVDCGLRGADPKADTLDGKANRVSQLYFGAHFMNDAVLTHTEGEWDSAKLINAKKETYQNNTAKEMDGTI